MDLLFTSSSLRRLLYLGVVILLIFLTKDHSPSTQINWLILSASLLTFITTGTTCAQRILITALTALTTAATLFIASLLSAATATAIYLVLVTIVCTYLSERYPPFFLPLFIINLLTILSSVFAKNSLLPSSILYGGIIASISYLIIWPYFLRGELQYVLLNSLIQLKALNKEIFSCFLQADYPINIYLYERRLHVKKNDFIKMLKALRNLVDTAETKLTSEKREWLIGLLAKLTLIYDIMLDCSTLRWRVTDHTIFSVCKQEMLIIAKTSEAEFDRAIAAIKKKKDNIHSMHLLDNIHQLEETYQNVIQVAAREPLVFILFLASLKRFAKEMQALIALEVKIRAQVL